MLPERSERTNFLCIFGRSGSGKTTLLRSLVQSPRPHGEACLVGAESLSDEIMLSLRSWTLESFRSKYLKVPRLYVDNLWVLRNKPATAAELCRLFRYRQRAGRMTVVASEFSMEEWRANDTALADFLASRKYITLLEKPRWKKPVRPLL